MTRPSHLTPPPLRHHQFINFEFMGMVTRAGLAIGGDEAVVSAQQSVTEGAEFLARPSAASIQQTAPLLTITDETFSRLARILDFTIEGRLVDNKSGLAAATTYLMPSIFESTGEMLGQYNLEQAQAYVISQAKREFYIYWGALARLYNEVSDDQKEAISGLFTHILRAPLQEMYSVKVPALIIPDELSHDAWTHEDEGDDFAYAHSEYLGTWLRDDIAINQFWVEGHLPDGQSSIFIASASNLQEAIAYATAYAINSSNNGLYKGSQALRKMETELISKLTIDFNRDVIAEASICAQKNNSNESRIAWNLRSIKDHRFPVFEFMSKVNHAESKLGVNWNKKEFLNSPEP